jgi:hypothetical protein
MVKTGGNDVENTCTDVRWTPGIVTRAFAAPWTALF